MRAANKLTALPLASRGGGTTATAVRLKRAEGTVGVSDGGGENFEPREDLGLYSGNGVETRSGSRARIDLEKGKPTKLDQDSEIDWRETLWRSVKR